ncbi:MAG: hypothetical protein RIT17_800, partial [Pseudomonadota bacterium]
MDHTGRFVHVQRKMLATSDEDTETAPVAPVATDTAVSGGAGISAEMLETIGEIAASQSMINHMLTDLAEADLAEDLDAAMRAAGHDWATAKTELHSLI